MLWQQDIPAIKQYTGETAANTAQTALNTDVIRSILVERQKLTLALNQISLLQDNGIVLSTVAPTDQIVEQVRLMTENSDSKVGELSLGTMPSLKSPSQAIDHVRGILDTMRNTYSGASQMWQSTQSWYSTASSGIANPWGVVDLAASGAGLVDQAGNVINNVSAIYSRIDRMVYTGRELIGTNWGDINSIVGVLGTPISEDLTLPTMVVPVSGKLLATLQDARTGYSQTRSVINRGSQVIDRGNQIIQGALGATGYDSSSPYLRAFVPGSDAHQRAAAYMVSDGLFLRPPSELDGAYFAMVQSGTPTDATVFQAATTIGNGSAYDSVVGWFASDEKRHRNNLNQTLSSGAYGAVQEFQAATRNNQPNAYARFAATMAPALPAILAGAESGKRLNITPEMVHMAEAMPPLNLSAFPPIASITTPVTDDEFEREILAYEEAVGRRIMMPASATQAGVLTIGLSGRQAEEYTSRIGASDGRLTQNNRMLNIMVSTLNYSQKALEANTRLRGAFAGLASMMTEANALESVPAMIQACDAMTLYLQRQISDYSLEVERLMKDRHTELSVRAGIANQAREKLARESRSRIASAITTGNRRGTAGVSQGAGNQADRIGQGLGITEGGAAATENRATE